jgi:hypothetical protein
MCEKSPPACCIAITAAAAGTHGSPSSHRGCGHGSCHEMRASQLQSRHRLLSCRRPIAKARYCSKQCRDSYALGNVKPVMGHPATYFEWLFLTAER